MKKYQDLGELLKNYRTYHRISQSEFAAQIDVDVRSVIRWEKNESLLSTEKEEAMANITFIPYQVIRNLNTPTQIPTFYDFDLRKYSLSAISSNLPDAEWIKSRIDIPTKRIKHVTKQSEFESIIRFIELQKNPIKSKNLELFSEASKLLPELNLVILDQSGYYSGHCIYLPLSQGTYKKIRKKEIEEHQLQPKDLINYKNHKDPVFYCHSITADCNENFFYIIGAVLKFFRDKPLDNYLYALLTSRYDSHAMSDQLGVKMVWEDKEAKEKYGLIDVPRLVEGNFNAFFKK